MQLAAALAVVTDPTLVAAVAVRMLVAVLVGMTPVFPGVPLRLRAALAVLLAGAAVPAAVRAGPATPPLALLVAGEAIVGLGLGLAVAAVLAAAAWAGSLLGSASGLAWAGDFDPQADGEAAGMSRLAWWLGLGGFLAAGGHLAVVAGFIDSVRTVPVGSCLAGTAARAGLAEHLTGLVAASFGLALGLALPALVAVVAAHAAAAVCMRTIRFEAGQGLPQAVAALVLVGGLLVGVDGWIRGFGQTATTQVERSFAPRSDSRP
jgi:flagellar biosynthesis protein FliR